MIHTKQGHAMINNGLVNRPIIRVIDGRMVKDMVCKVAVMYGRELARYGFTDAHPFGSDRLDAFWSRFTTTMLNNNNSSSINDYNSSIIVEKPLLIDEQILLEFHTREYVEFVKRASQFGIGYLDYGDTPAYKGIFEAACYVVGTTVRALDMVLTGRVDHAFNPIGGLHHARRGSAGGFCVFNDIGIAVMLARKVYGLKRIAYVDIDAHHGDGVYYEFEDDPLLFIADIHEDGRYLYPGTGFEYEDGKGEAKGTKLNIPLKPYSTSKEFIDAFKRVERFVEDARPELIIMQCGADGIEGDPLTHLCYGSDVHYYATSVLHSIAHEYCNGRIVVLGGGGYNRRNLANAWVDAVRALASNKW
ncbi:MAG: acetoin utilization protein AcuC [Candidatus Nitrosocaldus sp.]